jgi:hypothetical protein
MQLEPVLLEDRAVQCRAIDVPLADGDAYDLIFDNDGAGEIADVVSLPVYGIGLSEPEKMALIEYLKTL